MTYLTDLMGLGVPAAVADRMNTEIGSKVTLAQVIALLAAPPAIGGTTPAAGSFTTLSATGAVTGAGFTARFATPGPIGNTSASTGAFTTLNASGAFVATSTGQINGDVTFLSKMRVGAGSSLIFTDVALWLNGYAGAVTNNFTGVIHENLNFTSSGALSGNASLLNLFQAASDTVTNAAGVNFFQISHSYGGASATGDRNSLVVQSTLTSATGNAVGAGSKAYLAAYLGFDGQANNGGTSSAAADVSGTAFGLNVVVRQRAAATFYGGLVGQEINTWAEAGSSTRNKLGLQIVQVAGDMVAGSFDDAAISINNQAAAGGGSTVGWNYGLLFGRQGGYPSVKPTGTFIAAVANSGGGGAGTVDKGIDWSGVTFTTKSLDLPGFSVNGSGVATALYYDASLNNALTATGTTRADALALTKAVNRLTTVAASTGVVLPSAATVGIGGVVEIYNDGANVAKVYGPGSDTIDGTAGSTGVNLTNAKRCRYRVVAANTWISAQLGVVSA